jgi:predicted ABC-type ATPase
LDAFPELTIVAGPNGSGKSTFTRVLLSDSLLSVLDPDAIARQIAPATPERGAIRAGREVLRQRDLLLARRESFAIETTLAGVTTAHHIQAARAVGFRVTLVYICAEPVELCIGRVGQRVALGGLPQDQP